MEEEGTGCRDPGEPGGGEGVIGYIDPGEPGGGEGVIGYILAVERLVLPDRTCYPGEPLTLIRSLW